jgi:hypothetical protein
MISISELTESKGYKNLMKYVYGWGASVVLVGALFKIQHFPFASPMLIVGLLTEALIFFLSAFEPLHEELDWTLVYPELAGLTDDFEEDETQTRKFDRAHDVPQIVGGGSVVIGGGGVIGSSGGESLAAGTSGPGGLAFVGGGSPSALAKFDAMIEKAEITPELFEKLGQGLMSLNKTTSQLAEISEAGAATKEFVSKIKTASESVTLLGETYNKSSEVLKQTIGTLSDSYANSAQTFNQTNSQLSEAYSQFANKLTNEINSVGNLGAVYTEKLGSINNNLAALNTVYELQIQNMNHQIESSKDYFNGLNNMVENINQTVGHTKKLNEGVQQLEQNVSSLNNVYGNMLSSMNSK